MFDISIRCLQPHEQFFSYPAAVTITGDRAANFNPCLYKLIAVRVLFSLSRLSMLSNGLFVLLNSGRITKMKSGRGEKSFKFP
jgi:hypothetical protein